MALELVYDLRADSWWRDNASNVAPSPAVFASAEWWSLLGTPRLPLHRREGRVSRVYWASMGDYPMFELADGSGAVTQWTRMGDVARYVEGLAAAVEFVMISIAHPTSVPGAEEFLSGEHPHIVRVFLEESDLRSDPRAPGPGNVGLRDP